MSIMNFLQLGVHVVSDRRLLACLGQSLLTLSNGSARMRSTARQPRQIQRRTVLITRGDYHDSQKVTETVLRLHLLRIVLTLACSPSHLSGVSVQDA